MSQPLKYKIEATDTSISKLLKEQKFYIDYFQREYRWEEKHIKTLVEDLTNTFLTAFTEGDKRSAVASYQNYYLGPVVFSKNPEDGKKSIIDGQQRITSITLFLIYLNQLQKDKTEKVNISELIFSEKYGEKSFNMTDEDREECLEALFRNGEYTPHEDDSETVVNLINRYDDIQETFPEFIAENCLAHFIDWFTENVVIVEITAYSDDNAYTIFETMNDRGLSLTSTEMLKGYVLSKINDRKKRNEINDLWKNQIQKLNDFSKNADQSFFHSWFRGKYAASIRPGKAGAENQDFENIGSRFHNWFKENHEERFKLITPDDFYTFFKDEFPFYVKWYLKIWKARQSFDATMPHVHYVNQWGIADSLQEPLLLSTIVYGKDEDSLKKKVDLVAKYIETFTVRRSINYKKFGQTAIKYTMFNIIKKIRNNDFELLRANLIEEANDISQKWDAMPLFRLHGMNRKFVKHLLSRISGYVDNLVGKDTNYGTYHHPNGKQFQIEHIWGDKFNEHTDEFDQITDFQTWRNTIGALILIPQGTNQSYKDATYEEKLGHYLKENTYAQSLHCEYYQKNPIFLNNPVVQELQFKPHAQFKKTDIAERTLLVQRLCEKIWSIECN
jgi:uncharacterized protein with ParB-like and HNH nuclease domain